MEGLVADIAVGTKRGSDELLCATYINGPAMTTGGATANGNDSKKFKSDYRTASGPSRVLHLRKLPCDVTESEVIALALPFGKVTNLLLLKGKGQAFLEMCTEEIAMAMVDYYSSVSLHIRSQPVYLQFSNYKELKTDNSAQQARANAALQAVSSVSGVVSLEAALGDAVLSVGASPVLHIIVENLFYPVSLDVLHQIFSKFGTVLKVITFTKNSQFQALLQYADAQHAQHAKLSLDGQNIYNACCTLRVDFSKLTSLNVKFNNDKSRDYTRPELPQGDGGSGVAAAFEPAMVAAAFGPYGSGFPAAIGFPQAAGLSVPGMPLGLPAAAAAVRGVPLPSGLPASLSIPNCVLLASNLNSEVVTPQSLFILFGVYGDVHRVKILFNKKDNALIQMADSNQAQLAMSHLNGVRLYGKSLHVTLSRHQTVQLPREGHEDQGLTKDFSSSALHRFKKPGSKNFQNIYPPSSTLHLSNIPPAVAEEDLQRLFSEAGGEVRAFKFFPRDRKMALLQLGSVEEAISALIELHNHDLGDNHHLRVSFSKSSI